MFMPQDIIESAGVAQAVIQRMLHERKALQDAEVFLSVYKEALLSFDELDGKLVERKAQLGECEVRLLTLCNTYEEEKKRYEMLNVSLKSEHDTVVSGMKKAYEEVVKKHDAAMLEMRKVEEEKQMECQQALVQYNAALKVKRDELADVQETYDKVVAALRGMQRVAAV